MCYSSLPTEKRILLLQRPSHWCRETTVGSLSNSLLFISWSEALRLTHRAHTFCWLTYWVNEWSECGTKVSDISPGSFGDDSIRVHMQNIFFSHFSQFSWIFFFMLHSRSKTVANSLSLLPQNIPSAICSNLGTGGGGLCNCFDQENMEEVTGGSFQNHACPKTLAASNSWPLEHFFWGRPKLLWSMSPCCNPTLLWNCHDRDATGRCSMG